MPNDQQHALDEETIELVAEFVFARIQHLFFGHPVDPEIPKDEIREALRDGCGNIKLMEIKTTRLIVTHRNGHLFVHLGNPYAVIHQSSGVTDTWDDSFILDDRRTLYGEDGMGLLVEANKSMDDVTPQSDMPYYTATVLRLTRVDIHPFLDGLRAREGAVVA